MLPSRTIFRCLVILSLTYAGIGVAQRSETAIAMSLAREATGAAQAGDMVAFLEKMEAAVALRPDFPRLLVNLAAAQVANDQFQAAIDTLEQLAALGVSSPVERSEDFAALRERGDFQSVVAKLATNLQAKGAGQIAFTLRGITGLFEGIAWRETTGQFYFGDVNGRAVWRRMPDGTLERFTEESPDLLGVFGLVVDEASGTLWAATSAVPAMRGYEPEMAGLAALAEIDLETGAVRKVVRVPGRREDAHVLGDLVLGAKGSVFLTDSGAPVIWQLAPSSNVLEPLIESDEFLSLQGIVALPDGETLIVADYANGLLAVDLVARSVRRLESPPNATLIGIDGLTLAKNGDLIGIQNGLRPNRVLQISVDAANDRVTSVAILESGHLTMAAPALGCIATNGHLFFIGNAGWTRFDSADGRPAEPRSVPVFRTRL